MAFNPETVLWKRSEESSGNEDVWDDTALVEAYDRAVNEMKETIAKKNKAPTKPTSKKKGGKTKVTNSKQKAKKWQVGDFCQSLFSEDGKFYEAYIQSFDSEHKNCVVHYIGYENEEEVDVGSLRPSLGKKAREAQQMQAQQYQNGELNFDSGDVYSESSEVASASHKRETTKQRSYRPSEHFRPHQPGRHVQSPRFPPTIPPPPFSFPQWPLQEPHYPPHFGPSPTPPKLTPFPPPLPIPLEEGIVSDEEALASMLMSWYMSGYHTGYYQAMKICQSRQDGSRKNICSNCCHGNR